MQAPYTNKPIDEDEDEDDIADAYDKATSQLIGGAAELATSPVSGPGRCHIGSLAAPPCMGGSVNSPRCANRRGLKC